MPKMQGKWLKRILRLAQMLLSTSASLDIALSITINYTVPSWTLAAMSIGCILLIENMARMIK